MSARKTDLILPTYHKIKNGNTSTTKKLLLQESLKKICLITTVTAGVVRIMLKSNLIKTLQLKCWKVEWN